MHYINTCSGFSNRNFARTIDRFLSSRTDNWWTFGAERFFDKNLQNSKETADLTYSQCLLYVKIVLAFYCFQPLLPKYLNNQIGNLIHRIILPLSTSVYQHFDFVNQLEINWSILLLSDHDATIFSHANYWSHHQPSDSTTKYIQNMS